MYRRLRSRYPVHPHAERSHRLGNILYTLFTSEVERHRQLVLHVFAHCAGYCDTSGLRKGLQPRGDIYPVAIHRAVFAGDYVTQVDTDAKIHSSIIGEMTVAPRKFPLNLYRAFHGFDWAVKGGKNTIARRVDQMASMTLDVFCEDLAVFGEGVDGGFFVVAHQARVARYVSGKNGCKSSRLARFVHAIVPLSARERHDCAS
jgi:hypothetical protein